MDKPDKPDKPFFEIIGHEPDQPEDKASSPPEAKAESPKEPTPTSKPKASPFFEVIGDPAESVAPRSKKERREEEASAAPKPPPRVIEPPRKNAHGLAVLEGLSSRAYEHPADRAAMATLRKVPGLDLLLRKLIGLIGERSLRYLYLASAVRVSPSQFPVVHAAYLEVCEIFGMSEAPPELYVAQTPLVNAGAIGVDEPFIVLNSGTVQMLNTHELKVVLGHELGHILSDHVLYKTMLKLLLNFSFSNIGIPLGNIAIFGIVVALREWDRKSELSCDRAALLAVQDPRLCFTVHMKLAGGGDTEEMDLDAFIAQAEEYERAGGSVTDGIFKLLNLIGQTHPFHVTRLAELKQWSESGAYDAILTGDYPRRDVDEEASVYGDVKEGAQAYRESYERSEDPLMRFLGDVGTTVSDAASSAWSSTRNFFSRGEKDGKDKKDKD